MKIDYDRPSMHGKYLGEALVLIAKAGRRAAGVDMPEPCLTCAFRSGTVANMMASTVLTAFNCALRVDDSPFACHHGMKDGHPTRECAGYNLALLAPFAEAKEIVAAMYDQLTRLAAREDGEAYIDAVRADFDAWYESVDPEQKMDVYQLSRAYAARENRT